MNLQGNVGQIVSGALSGKLIKNIGTQTQMAEDQNKIDEANKRVGSQLFARAYKDYTIRDILSRTMSEPITRNQDGSPVVHDMTKATNLGDFPEPTKVDPNSEEGQKYQNYLNMTTTQKGKSQMNSMKTLIGLDLIHPTILETYLKYIRGGKK